MLTDLLLWAQTKGNLVKNFFTLVGVHEGAHEWCPGFCPCDAFDFEPEYAAEAELLAA